jgi:hypothetical protein
MLERKLMFKFLFFSKIFFFVSKGTNLIFFKILENYLVFDIESSN